MYKFGKSSKRHLGECHPDLQHLAKLSLKRSFELNLFDFGIIDGGRTVAEQEENISNGVSWTMNSRHLFKYPKVEPVTMKFSGSSLVEDFYSMEWSHAFDFAIYVHGKIKWEFPLYERLYNEVFKVVAEEEGIKIKWGGEWKSKDGPHIQLTKKAYPVK